MNIRLDCAPTFRDLGGIQTRDGARLRTGLLFRSGTIGQPTENDMETLDRIQIRTVLDLRSQRECELHPNGWGEACGAKVIWMEVDADVRANNRELVDRLRRDPSETGARELMMHIYRNFPQSFERVLPQMYNFLEQRSNQPVLIHCTAGKDRTGFACALLMHALGVDEETILADFVRTSDFIQHESLAATFRKPLDADLSFVLDGAALRILCDVRREYIVAAFESVEIEYGSINSYLERVAGLVPSRSRQLRELFLE